jgi:hypothetical protein
MEIKEVWATYDPQRRECAWAKLVYEQLGGKVLVPGFGSADCKRFPRPLRCQAHFCHFVQRPKAETFYRLVRQEFPDHAGVEIVDGGAVMA